MDHQDSFAGDSLPGGTFRGPPEQFCARILAWIKTRIFNPVPDHDCPSGIVSGIIDPVSVSDDPSGIVFGIFDPVDMTESPSRGWLGAGPKKSGGPAPQIAIVHSTVAPDPFTKSDRRHSERYRLHFDRDLLHQTVATGPKQRLGSCCGMESGRKTEKQLATGPWRHSESRRGWETNERDDIPAASGPKQHAESCRRKTRAVSSGKRSAPRKALSLTNWLSRGTPAGVR